MSETDGHILMSDKPARLRDLLNADGIKYTETYLSATERWLFHAYPTPAQVAQLLSEGYRFSPNHRLYLQ